MSTSSITRSLARRALSTAQFQQSMYYNKPQRNMDEADKIRGMEEERKNEKSLFFQLFDKYADQYYKFVYQNRPNSSFVKIFEANKFCRLISVDGIPGSGYEQVAKDLADHKHLLLREWTAGEGVPGGWRFTLRVVPSGLRPLARTAMYQLWTRRV